MREGAILSRSHRKAAFWSSAKTIMDNLDSTTRPINSHPRLVPSSPRFLLHSPAAERRAPASFKLLSYLRGRQRVAFFQKIRGLALHLNSQSPNFAVNGAPESSQLLDCPFRVSFCIFLPRTWTGMKWKHSEAEISTHSSFRDYRKQEVQHE